MKNQWHKRKQQKKIYHFNHQQSGGAAGKQGALFFMKHLNNKSTHIFLKLIKKLGEEDHVKIESKSFMPLTLEFLHHVQTDTGQGKMYSLSHTYIQNGD